MPELPEVETIRRSLEQTLLGQTLQKVQINRHDLRSPIPWSLPDIVQESRVITTKRRGKYMLVFLDNGQVMVLHLGMSGRIKIFEPGTPYEPAKHDHVIFETAEGVRIVFNDPRRFGMLYLMSQDSWESERPFSHMGPEPLDNRFNGPVLAGRLKNKNTSIKSALLDQRVVAGVGNIYACEALYQSNIHPLRKASQIHKAESEVLARAIRNVLNEAIMAGGSSLRDYAKTDGTLGYFQTVFSVYDREGAACPRCDCDLKKSGGIKRITQSGRSTFYCEHKQAKK